MRLNLQTDFALRVLMTLADRPDPAPTVRDLADRLNLSNNHLMKIVAALRGAGWVQARRGRQGGIFLTIDPAQLTLRAVVERFEGAHALVDCFGQGSSCTLLPTCRLKGTLQKALMAFYAELDQKTLADMRTNPEQRPSNPQGNRTSNCFDKSP